MQGLRDCASLLITTYRYPGPRGRSLLVGNAKRLYARPRTPTSFNKDRIASIIPVATSNQRWKWPEQRKSILALLAASVTMGQSIMAPAHHFPPCFPASLSTCDCAQAKYTWHLMLPNPTFLTFTFCHSIESSSARLWCLLVRFPYRSLTLPLGGQQYDRSF